MSRSNAWHPQGELKVVDDGKDALLAFGRFQKFLPFGHLHGERFPGQNMFAELKRLACQCEVGKRGRAHRDGIDFAQPLDIGEFGVLCPSRNPELLAGVAGTALVTVDDADDFDFRLRSQRGQMSVCGHPTRAD
jgi:hypothetical protein